MILPTQVANDRYFFGKCINLHSELLYRKGTSEHSKFTKKQVEVKSLFTLIIVMKNINNSLVHLNLNSSDEAGDILELYNNGLFAFNTLSFQYLSYFLFGSIKISLSFNLRVENIKIVWSYLLFLKSTIPNEKGLKGNELEIIC